MHMRLSPPQVVLLSFAAAIFVGSAVLSLPGMTVAAGSLSYIDALFTAASAVCVTGLITVDTATVFTPVGKAAIAVLIQLGGLGIMTAATLLFLLAGRRIGLQSRLVIQETLGHVRLAGVVRLVLAILLMTAAFEGLGALAPGTIFLFVMLMFIGASPESTGGGIKTTTLGIILASIWATFRGAGDTEFASRRIGQAQVTRALTLAATSAAFVLAMTLILLDTGQDIPLDTGLFEVVSAFGTVGLSLGLTSKLTLAGKPVIIFTMYDGRVGPMTVGAALIARRHPLPRTLPEERLPTG